VHNNADNEVCAIIVTYDAADELLDNIAAIRPQVSRLVLVDNGSRPEGVALVERARASFDCELIQNNSNLGIAKALNIGIGRAASHGNKKVIFFDQDSIVGDQQYVASMLEVYSSRNQFARVAIVVPRYMDRSSGATLPLTKTRDGRLLTSITSGSFVPMYIFQTLGLHDESLYMDYVDIEFSLRCRRAGYSIVEAPRATLRHSLGALTTHRLGTRAFTSTHHNPTRRYFITRNRLLLMRTYWRDWAWFVHELSAFSLELIKIILVERDKGYKIRNIARGMVHAFQGKTGKQIAL
jgi:rhamnosyltransferase